jgi:hypothetical protein
LQRLAALSLLLIGVLPQSSALFAAAEDHRAWQHGIDLVRIDGRLLVVWGSPGNPPRANPGGDWQHDVYYAWLIKADSADAALTEPQLLVAAAEAQEPPSTAINSAGSILMTTEDGNGGINQHAGLWDESLKVLRKYPFLVKRGGHSGHVAAMGKRFLVVYGEGWVDGGGWLDLGTGQNVFARVIDGDGTPGSESRLTELPRNLARDSWPLVAGSDRNWLAVWQRYPQMSLQAALIDATGKVLARRIVIDGLSPRYAYDVAFAPQLAAYVVAGSSGKGGFVALVGLDGEVMKSRRELPAMAAESRILIGADSADASAAIGVYPVSPHGIAVVRLSANAIELLQLIDHPYQWDHAGTTGTFTAAGRVVFVTLSQSGVKVIPVELPPRSSSRAR